jgi:hypothetical protein
MLRLFCSVSCLGCAVVAGGRGHPLSNVAREILPIIVIPLERPQVPMSAEPLNGPNITPSQVESLRHRSVA